MEQEIYHLPQMDGHEFILKFVAAERHTSEIDGLPEFWLMTEYQEHGSLHDYLRMHAVTWEQLYKIAFSFAR